MTGISRSTISALENNRLFLSSHYALLIAEALKCSLNDLYEERGGSSSLKVSQEQAVDVDSPEEVITFGLRILARIIAREVIKDRLVEETSTKRERDQRQAKNTG